MALNIKPKGSASVAVAHVANKVITSESTTSEKVELPAELVEAQSLTPLCEVGLEAAYTHGLPNYSSVRMGVSLKIGCQHSEIDAVYAYAESWIDARMGKLKDDLTGE